MNTVEHFYLTWVFPGCRVVHYPRTSYTETVFEDGAKVPAAPIDSEEYRETAQRLGYGSDTARMCLEHEIGHTFLSLKQGKPYSATLWALAHGQDATLPEHLEEEDRVLAFQRYAIGTGDSWRAEWRQWAIEFSEIFNY